MSLFSWFLEQIHTRSSLMIWFLLVALIRSLMCILSTFMHSHYQRFFLFSISHIDKLWNETCSRLVSGTFVFYSYVNRIWNRYFCNHKTTTHFPWKIKPERFDLKGLQLCKLRLLNVNILKFYTSFTTRILHLLLQQHMWDNFQFYLSQEKNFVIAP